MGYLSTRRRTMASTTVTQTTAGAAAMKEAKPMLKIWMDGELVDRDQAKISVYDHGLLYGDGCFEGIRIYNHRILKLASHLKRMYRSAGKIRLEPSYNIEEIEKATRETVKINNLKDGYIRMVFTRGFGDLGLDPRKCPRPCHIIIADAIQLYPAELYETGIPVIVSERPRLPIKCLDPSVKSLNYLNNIMAKIEAIDAGVLEAIMLNLDGYVSECTGDNLFMIKDEKIYTPPLSAGLLGGITRQWVIDDIGPDCGYPVTEKNLRIEEVLDADEVFLTGSGAEVIGVNKINEKVISGGKTGPITAKLIAEFKRRVAADAPED
jgi:branched-chain amino acid aminotransferase